MRKDDGIEWVIVGDRTVGGSHLQYVTVVIIQLLETQTRFFLPHTHNMNVVAFYGHVHISKNIRKAKHALSVAGCAFRKYNDRSIGLFANIFQ